MRPAAHGGRPGHQVFARQGLRGSFRARVVKWTVDLPYPSFSLIFLKDRSGWGGGVQGRAQALGGLEASSVVCKHLAGPSLLGLVMHPHFGIWSSEL